MPQNGLLQFVNPRLNFQPDSQNATTHFYLPTNLCERLGQAEDARAYNELITSWTGIESAAATAKPPEQAEFFNR